MEKPSLFQGMATKWPSAMVARTEIKNFTGGFLSEKYLANLDSAGLGPAGRIKCGRKVLYPVTELIVWLENRSSVCPPDRHKMVQAHASGQ